MLTQLLTLTTTHKFPFLDHLAVAHVGGAVAAHRKGRRHEPARAAGPAVVALQALLLALAKDSAQRDFEAFLLGGGRGPLLGCQLGYMQRVLQSKLVKSAVLRSRSIFGGSGSR